MKVHIKRSRGSSGVVPAVPMVGTGRGWPLGQEATVAASPGGEVALGAALVQGEHWRV